MYLFYTFYNLYNIYEKGRRDDLVVIHNITAECNIQNNKNEKKKGKIFEALQKKFT